jgi:hypothetical protein
MICFDHLTYTYPNPLKPPWLAVEGASAGMTWERRHTPYG